jgi:hypothetical protein
MSFRIPKEKMTEEREDDNGNKWCVFPFYMN